MGPAPTGITVDTVVASTKVSACALGALPTVLAEMPKLRRAKGQCLLCRIMLIACLALLK